MEQQLTPFNYEEIESSLVSDLKAVAERIRLRLKKTAEDIIEIGKDLIQVKEKLEHGQFTPWLQAEFDISERTARRFMKVAELFESKTDTVSVLTPKALYELSAPSTPESVRNEVMEKLGKGDIVKAKEIQALKKRAQIEKVRREEAERQITQLMGKIQKDQAQMLELDQVLNKLRSKPPNVVEKEVLPEGYRSIDSAIKDMEKKKKNVEKNLSKCQSELDELEASTDRKKVLHNRTRQLKRLGQQIDTLSMDIETDKLLALISSDSQNVKNELNLLAIKCEKLAQLIKKRLNDPRSNIIEIPAETLN